MKAFFDSNILVYAFSDDQRRERAAEAIALGGRINVQVLNEFTNVLIKKQKLPWPAIEQAIAAVEEIFSNIQPLTSDVHRKAVNIARKHKLNFYDALIVAAAIESDCDVLFSEDMQHGLIISNLQIINPFITS